MSDTAAAAVPPPLAAETGKPSLLGKPRNRFILGVAVAAAILAAGTWAWSWWTRGRFLETTNNAYLAADSVALAPRVPGYLEAVLVENNQAVRAGELLARIEGGPLAAALAEAEANLAQRRADLLRLRAELRMREAGTQESRARLAAEQSAAAQARRDAIRAAALAASGAGQRDRSEAAEAAREQADARVSAGAAAVRISIEARSMLAAQIEEADAAILAARARVASASQDLAATELRAPAAGRIGDKTARPGQYVQPGTRLMTIVPTREIYITANFKETQVSRIRPGQPVRIAVDALPGKTLVGTVDSLAPGTGSTFALLPPENATGNFTKIVQRVPVRIRLRLLPEQRARLAPGLSAEVEVDTRENGS